MPIAIILILLRCAGTLRFPFYSGTCGSAGNAYSLEKYQCYCTMKGTGNGRERERSKARRGEQIVMVKTDSFISANICVIFINATFTYIHMPTRISLTHNTQTHRQQAITTIGCSSHFFLCFFIISTGSELCTELSRFQYK